jgi:hypothetical protein
VGAINDLDDELRADWGEREVGLLKVFVLLPLALLLASVIARGGIALGRSLRTRARARPPRAAPRPAPTAPLPAAAQPEPEPTAVVPEAAAPVAAAVPEPAATRAEAAPAPPRPKPATASAFVPVAPPPEPAPAEEEGLVPIGHPVTLHGIDRERTVVEVTVSDAQALPPDPPGLAPPERVLTVRLRLHNLGEATYVDYPTGGARVVCTDGTHLRPARHRREPALREVRLEPGDETEGFLSFELPEAADPLRLQFALDVGVAPETAAWRLAGSVPGP